VSSQPAITGVGELHRQFTAPDRLCARPASKPDAVADPMTVAATTALVELLFYARSRLMPYELKTSCMRTTPSSLFDIGAADYRKKHESGSRNSKAIRMAHVLAHLLHLAEKYRS